MGISGCLEFSIIACDTWPYVSLYSVIRDLKTKSFGDVVVARCVT